MRRRAGSTGTCRRGPPEASSTRRNRAWASLDLAGDANDRQRVASWFRGTAGKPRIPDSVGQPAPRAWAQSLPLGGTGAGAAFDEFSASDQASDLETPTEVLPRREHDRRAKTATDAGAAGIARSSEKVRQRRTRDQRSGPSDGGLTARRAPGRLEASLRLRDAFEAVPKAIQVHDSYLIAETGDGMVVIDQHALHERILYEELRNRVARGNIESQGLLIPEPVDLPAAEAALLIEQSELLAQLGLEIESFGGDTVLVQKRPGDAPAGQPGSAGARPGRALADAASAAEPRRGAWRADAYDRVQGGRQGRPTAFVAGNRGTPGRGGISWPTRITVLTAGRRRLSSRRPILKSSLGGPERSHATFAGMANVRRLVRTRDQPLSRVSGVDIQSTGGRWVDRASRPGQTAEAPGAGGVCGDDLRNDRAGAAFFAGGRMEECGRSGGGAGRAADRLPAPRAGSEADSQGAADSAGFHDSPRGGRRSLARQGGSSGSSFCARRSRRGSITSTSRSDIAGKIRRFGKTKRIISYHNMKTTPVDIEDMSDQCAEFDPDIIKIATAASTLAEASRVLHLATKSKAPMIPIAMGEIGDVHADSRPQVRSPVHVRRIQSGAGFRRRDDAARRHAA